MAATYTVQNTGPTADTGTKMADVALVLAAHGSVRRPEANMLVERHAADIRQRNIFHSVSTVFLSTLSDAPVTPVDATVRTVLVVPYMMSDGFLCEEVVSRVRDSLGADCSDRRIEACDPVGTHEQIADIVAALATDILRRHGHDPEHSDLLMVAHGSSERSESRITAERHMRRVAARNQFRAVHMALLEEAPLLEDVLATLTGPVAVVGLFAAPGGHAVDDIGAAIISSGRDDLLDAGAIGLNPRMADLTVIRAEQALRK